MYIVIYEFKVKENNTQKFIQVFNGEIRAYDNVDYSIYEDIKTRYGANEEPILKSCPELFYKMVLPLIF